MLALATSACAAMAEDRRLEDLVETREVNGRMWDFVRDGDYLYVRPSGLQSYINDMRFKRETTTAAEAFSGCRFSDPVWDENLVSRWTVMGRLDCADER